MKFAFIAAREVAFPVSAMCRVLGVAKSGYYAWRKRPKPERERRDAQLAAAVAAVHKRSRLTYGSPRVHRELKARGVRVGKKRIERLMRQNGLKGRLKRRFKRTTDSRHGGPIAPNLLARHFDVSEPNRAWVTDVTAIATDEGWLYLAPMIDLCARRVLAWAASERNDTALALDVLRKSLGVRRPRRGFLHHSDRGSPYASEEYRAALRACGAVQSMSRKGRLLGQRRHRELLRYPARRARRPRTLPDARSSNAIHRRLHRQLLQRRAAPFAPRLPQPHRVRIAIPSSGSRGIVRLSTEPGELHCAPLRLCGRNRQSLFPVTPPTVKFVSGGRWLSRRRS